MILRAVRKRNRLAVSFAEIIIAVAMMGVAALPIFGLLTYSSRGTREQEAEAEAGNLAKEEMNRLMYVVEPDNLLKDAGSDVPCSFAGNTKEVNKKGNVFKGIYTIYPHENKNVKFKVPQMVFHRPQGCPNGAEQNSDVVSKDLIEMDLQKLYPNNTKPLLVDIYLQISWRLATEKTYPDKNRLVLYGRRYFNVEE